LSIDTSSKSASIVHRRPVVGHGVQQQAQLREGFEIDIRFFAKAKGPADSFVEHPTRNMETVLFFVARNDGT